MKNHFQNIRKGLEDRSQRLYGDMMQGLKSFSENPGKYTLQLGKDYWDLLVPIITGYAGIKIATKTGTSQPLFLDYLATQAIWFASMFSPYVLKPEKTNIGNHFRAVRNLFGGVIPTLHFINPAPWDWLLTSMSVSVGILYEHARHRERKRASKLLEPGQKPKNLESTINQNS